MGGCVHPDGFILGGACHKRLNDRAARTRGAWMAWSDAQRQRCVRTSHGWLQMVDLIELRALGEYGGGNAENGYRRARGEVFLQLVETKRKFRMSWMARWLDGVARLEFAVAAKTPLGPFAPGFAEPKGKDDELYAKGHAKSYARQKMREVLRRSR